jgi:Co/Zn/Cd efflux system component
MSTGHTHALPSERNEKSLWIALALTGSFLLAEVAAGIVFNSLALLSDAAHMFTDAAALAIALAAVRVARRPADAKRTYGYYRFEILAAAFNALLLFGVAGYILYEGWQRLREPAQVQSSGMLVVAVLGLIVNLISMRMLQGGKDKSLNVKGAYLEVWSDMLGSIGVIGAALVIRFTGWVWVDAVVADGAKHVAPDLQISAFDVEALVLAALKHTHADEVDDQTQHCYHQHPAGLNLRWLAQTLPALIQDVASDAEEQQGVECGRKDFEAVVAIGALGIGWPSRHPYSRQGDGQRRCIREHVRRI